MGGKPELKFDEIGYWSELKLEIIKAYAEAFSKILAAQRRPRFEHVYIDGFAGAGLHVSRTTKQLVEGSPLQALSVTPGFSKYYFVESDPDKVAYLADLVQGRSDVRIWQGDCNRVLPEEIFPEVRYEDYRRGLCFLDPYGLQLHWKVIEAAGKLGTIDMILNFPVMDINRNAIWRDPDKVPSAGIERMNAFWGDDWRSIAYDKEQTLFGERDRKVDNQTIADAFRKRLRDVAGFKWVAEPLPMRNSKGAIVYYLFFASQKPVAEKIIKHIFEKYRDRGVH